MAKFYVDIAIQTNDEYKHLGYIDQEYVITEAQMIRQLQLAIEGMLEIWKSREQKPKEKSTEP